MNAILLAAGFGTRLRPLTETLPKCLVPIAGEPLLGIWLQRLAAAGVDKFLINTHYLHQQVANYINAHSLRSRIEIAHESILLGTAGTLAAHLDFLAGDDALLIHADNWCLADLPGFIAAHRARQPRCMLTMLAFRTETPLTCGILEADDDGVVTGFHEKVANPPGNLANGAVYLMSPEFLEEVRANYVGVTDFSTQVLPEFVGRIQSYETTAPFLDIGTPASYARAQELARALPFRT